VVARGSLGVLTMHFKKLDTVRDYKQFKCSSAGSSCALTKEVQVGGTSGSSSALTRQFRKLDRGTRLQAVQLH
jgi:hypothetical protein